MDNARTPVMDALVEFVLTLETASLPPAVVEAATRSMTDWLGTAIRGAAEPLAGALAAVITAAGGEPQATVVGRRLRTSALLACLANGAQSHALDFDDTHLPSIVHGSAPVAPVVLALGAGKLLGLDAGRLAQALGIAGTQAAGLEQSFGTMSKPLHPGKAAMNGLLAALLAREGFTGATAMLDGPHGLPGTFVGVTDLGAAVEDLGKRFEILENSTKPYAACHLTHATIDAGRAIRGRFAPEGEAVAAVRCHVHPLVLKVANHVAPRTGLEAKFSVAFCAAMALVRGEAGEGEFSEASLRDPAVVGLMARVTPEADASLPMGAARMSVRLADGRVLEERVTAARGTPENPLTRDELEAKFRRLAEVVLPAERVTQLVTALRGLTDLPDVAELPALAAG